ncbi:solute carrier family 22 member 11 isoform X2 [Sciurus carolinensis]|uniref:solute carrier family 22 member 11 isoform X2 n=1 Tax=Sciurus carolinensis TaxID=30640 RepID=UPI001FB355D3|nr:solute carrier family 22 member 11 isoform X2 [Sciurus carolinensis]
MAFEELLERTGGMGLFQALQVFTLLLLAVWIPSQMLIENFSAAIPDHRCWARTLDNGSETPANLTLEALLAVSVPPGPSQQPHQCLRFRQPQWQLLDPNATAANWSEAATEPCVDGWVYDHSTFTSTIVTKWDLVCSSQALKPVGQSIYMAGILVGSFIWGLLSCRLRFLAAFGIAGIILTLSTLMVEWTTTHKRAATMTMLGCTYSMGQMALAGLAFALRDWQDLQLAVSVPLFVISLMSWWLPESARWLIIRGRTEQALRELKKVARINGHKEAKKTLTIEVLMSSMEEELVSAEDRGSVLDLFRVPMLRWRTCALLMLLPVLLLLRTGPGPAEPGQGHLPPAGPLRSRGLPGPGHHRPLAQVPWPPQNPGRVPGPGWLCHPGQRVGATRSADPALGLCCAGKRMLWDELHHPHRLQDRALPNVPADDSRRVPAVSRPPGSHDGPPGQDGPPGAAPAASPGLWGHPHRFQPASVLPPGDPGTATPRLHPGPGESGINCSQGRPARGGHSRKHLALEVCPCGALWPKSSGDRAASSPVRGWKPGGRAQPGCLGLPHERRGSSPSPCHVHIFTHSFSGVALRRGWAPGSCRRM